MANFKGRSGFESKVLGAFLAALLAALLLSSATWKVAKEANEAAGWVARSHEVLTDLADTRAQSLLIELTTQSFRISGDEDQLRERDAASVAREILLQRIQSLTADNPEQQRLWRDLRRVVDQRIAIADEVVRLRRSQGLAAASAYAAGAPLRQTRSEIYGLLQSMHAEEAAQLTQRNSALARTRERQLQMVVLVSLSLLVLLALTYGVIRRQLQANEASRQALAEQQRTIRQQNELLEQRVHERTQQLADSQAHLQTLIGNVPVLIAYVDAAQRYVYVNPQYQLRFAAGEGDITGRTVRDVLGPQRYAVASPLITQALQGQQQSYEWEPFTGEWQTINYFPRADVSGRVLGYYVVGVDISERKRAEDRVQALNGELAQRVRDLEHVSRALRTLSSGNRAMLRATEEQGLLESMCQAIVQAGGYALASVWYRPQDEATPLQPRAQHGLVPNPIGLRRQLLDWVQTPAGQQAMADTLRTGEPCVLGDRLATPLRAATMPNGCGAGLVCPLRVLDQVIGVLVIFAVDADAFDVAEQVLLGESAADLAFGIAKLRADLHQQQTQAEMNRLVRFDSLTGLPNATQFTEQLALAVEQGLRQDQRFALLQINIDRLSEINDALGFHHGDQLLCAFADRLREVTAPGHLVARLRGDEFAVLLQGCDADQARAQLLQLEAAVQRPYPVADILLDVSMCTGMVLFPVHGTQVHDLFQRVDIAVHQARRRGGAHVLFDLAQIRDHSGQLNMAGELRRAIEGGELRLFLQPKVEMASGRVCGAEGLVRWQHTRQGLIGPGQFIALAEHTGLIRPLTDWVIEAALRLGQAWAAQGLSVPIAVNLSARNLRDEYLLDRIRALRRNFGETQGLLELELTESAVMDDAAFALNLLRNLRDDGITLYIDDFGTGYSSLSYLQQLPVDYIKIDQSFVRDMVERKDSALIVRSTIDLVHDLGRKTVAEGVETLAQWDMLASMGCDMVQGYFIARPMPAEQFPAWARDYAAR